MSKTIVAAVWYMMKKYPLFRWKLREFTFEWLLAMRALKTGLPMALQQLMVSASSSGLSTTMGRTCLPLSRWLRG